MRPRNPYPGVRPECDPSGKRRWRFRRVRKGVKVIDTYLPDPYGGTEFIAAYDAAIQAAEAGQRAPATVRAPRGTVAHVIEDYLASRDFLDLKTSTRHAKRLRLDRIKRNLGRLALTAIRPHHVRKVMDKFDGPTAANRFKKDLSQLYSHAAGHLGFTGPNPAKAVPSRKTRKGGHHTWTDAEIAAFRKRHPCGTKARLAMELLLNTGAARVDAVQLGRQNVRGASLTYRRQKTDEQGDEVIEVTVPIFDPLAAELAVLPRDQMLFLTHGKGLPYTRETFGNLFRDWCIQADVPGRAHGLRKAGARIAAEEGATDKEVAAILGHADTRMASTYTAAADRTRNAASGMQKSRLRLAGNSPKGFDPLGKSTEDKE